MPFFFNGWVLHLKVEDMISELSVSFEVETYRTIKGFEGCVGVASDSE